MEVRKPRRLILKSLLCTLILEGLHTRTPCVCDPKGLSLKPEPQSLMPNSSRHSSSSRRLRSASRHSR